MQRIERKGLQQKVESRKETAGDRELVFLLSSLLSPISCSIFSPSGEKIGATRFELATSRSRTVRSIQAELRPAIDLFSTRSEERVESGPPEITPRVSRSPHHSLRSPALFLAVLRPKINACSIDLSDLAGSVNSINSSVGRKDGAIWMLQVPVAHAVPAVFVLFS